MVHPPRNRVFSGFVDVADVHAAFTVSSATTPSLLKEICATWLPPPLIQVRTTQMR